MSSLVSITYYLFDYYTATRTIKSLGLNLLNIIVIVIVYTSCVNALLFLHLCTEVI